MEFIGKESKKDMDALISSLAFHKVPRIEIDRKRKCGVEKESGDEKRPRILNELVKGYVKSSLVPSYTSEGLFERKL